MISNTGMVIIHHNLVYNNFAPLGQPTQLFGGTLIEAAYERNDVWGGRGVCVPDDVQGFLGMKVDCELTSSARSWVQ